MKTIECESEELTTTYGGSLVCKYGYTLRIDGESYCIGISWQG